MEKMACRRRTMSVVEEKPPFSAKGRAAGEDSVIVVADGSYMASEIAKLRGRWELASVLNFLSVFEPLVGKDSKLTAEDIETALVKPNTALAHLHITLLKGVPPVSKQLNVSGAWVTALCKKLCMWWPWVAEGEMPLKIANGEEVQRYKELDPISRLLILKALCEIRADQDDAVSYINDALKQGSSSSCFRKDRVGGDGSVTSYWCDGNTVIGHRLYKEVSQKESKTKMKRKPSESLPDICCLWETVATNLEEFRKVVDELNSSKLVHEVAVGKTIMTEFLPAVEKFQKRKDKAMKQKKREEKLLSNFRSYAAGMTRSCRISRPVSYTFEEYDRAIDEATEPELLKKSWTNEGERNSGNVIKQGNITSNGDRDVGMGSDLKECLLKNGDSDKYVDLKSQNGKKNYSLAETDAENLQEDANHGKDSDDDYNVEDEDDNNDEVISESDNSDEKDNLHGRNNMWKPVGPRRSQRLTGVAQDIPLGAKHRLRQRPTRNSAIDIVVPDSDDDFVKT